MSDRSPQLGRIVERLCRLSADQLDRMEQYLRELETASATVDRKRLSKRSQSGAGPPHSKMSQSGGEPTCSRDWPRAPVHRLSGKGTYIVTAGTLYKEHFFRNAERLTLLECELLRKAKEYGWHLEAWAVFSNHYHFVGTSLDDAESLRPFLSDLHTQTAREVNRRDGEPDRQVWFNFWETELTYRKSYFARLNYVHQNARKHGLVAVANQYRWCSAAWFERTATPAQVKTIYNFKTDRLKVIDDYEVLDVR